MLLWTTQFYNNGDIIWQEHHTNGDKVANNLFLAKHNITDDGVDDNTTSVYQYRSLWPVIKTCADMPCLLLLLLRPCTEKGDSSAIQRLVQTTKQTRHYCTSKRLVRDYIVYVC